MAKEAQQPTYDDKVSDVVASIRPKGNEPKYIECVMPDTGEQFTAEVQPSSRFPSGRITTLVDLTYPQEMVPPGLPRDSIQRKQWIYENHYKRLLQQFVGKPATSLLMFRKDMQERVKKIEGELGKLG